MNINNNNNNEYHIDQNTNDDITAHPPISAQKSSEPKTTPSRQKGAS